MESRKDKLKRLRALGKLGGLAGGNARAAILTPEERVYIAKLGAAARWAGHARAQVGKTKPASGV